MSKITPEARQRIAAKSLQEQLEDCRRAMQRANGADDMRTIDAHLNADNWQTRVRHVPEPAFGNIDLFGSENRKPDIGIPISAMRIDGAD